MRFLFFFFFSSRRRHTRCYRDWSSDVCSSDLSACAATHSRRCCLATPSLQLPKETVSAENLLLWAYEQFGDRLCLTCSWQKQSSVLVHMVSELEVPVDVVELDTQLFFRESYETRDRLVERYGLELIRPKVLTVAEQHRREGPNL